MKDTTERFVVILLVIGIIISATAAILISSRFAQLDIPITGFVLVPNATVTLNIGGEASLTFIDESVDWGNVAVNLTGGHTDCVLATVTGNAPDECTDGAENSVAYETSGLALENDGNSNLTVELMSNATAAQFIGGSSPWFQWNVTLQEAGSCENVTTNAKIPPNTTSATAGNFENVSNNTNKIICPRLLFANANDALNISINISVPFDASSGARSAKITATGTTVT